MPENKFNLTLNMRYFNESQDAVYELIDENIDDFDTTLDLTQNRPFGIYTLTFKDEKKMAEAKKILLRERTNDAIWDTENPENNKPYPL